MPARVQHAPISNRIAPSRSGQRSVELVHDLCDAHVCDVCTMRMRMHDAGVATRRVATRGVARRGVARGRRVLDLPCQPRELVAEYCSPARHPGLCTAPSLCGIGCPSNAVPVTRSTRQTTGQSAELRAHLSDIRPLGHVSPHAHSHNLATQYEYRGPHLCGLSTVRSPPFTPGQAPTTVSNTRHLGSGHV